MMIIKKERNKMSTVLFVIIGLVVGLLIGAIFTRQFSSKVKKFNEMKKELEQAKLELFTQKQVIIKHFSHSAEILDNMAKDFRQLYKHMAENSSTLLSKDELEQLIEKMPSSVLTDSKSPLNDEPKELLKNDTSQDNKVK